MHSDNIFGTVSLWLRRYIAPILALVFMCISIVILNNALHVRNDNRYRLPPLTLDELIELIPDDRFGDDKESVIESIRSGNITWICSNHGEMDPYTWDADIPYGDMDLVHIILVYRPDRGEWTVRSMLTQSFRR